MAILVHLSQNLLSTSRLIRNFTRQYGRLKRTVILGIETSCDDTGCAIVDNNGTVLGDALNSQHIIHLNNGGIIPPLAQSLHRENIENVVNEAIQKANVDFSEIDAVATTVKPGLPLSLLIGMKYGKHLCRTHGKPFIPIHHMEAHALTARMCDASVTYPFLVLLISGGHCLLAVVKSVDEFVLLGQSIDDAPGEAFDKAARRLKLRNVPGFEGLSGGRAVELAAARASAPLTFAFRSPLSKYRDCNFSMAGLKNKLLRHVLRQERVHGVEADGVIPGVFDLCAGFQLAVARHLWHRTQRAMEYVRVSGLLPGPAPTLVVSGGVACNDYIARGLQVLCSQLGFRLVRPPPRLCTDNGIMIAWNGMERWQVSSGVLTDFEAVQVEPRCPLGTDASEEVVAASLRCRWVKVPV